MSRIPWMPLLAGGFFIAASALWLVLNHAPPQWDDAWYLANSLAMFDALAAGGVPGYFAKFLTILRIKPPLITVLPTPAYLLLGRTVHAAFLVNLVSMAVIFAVLYSLGRRFQNARVGTAAIFVAGTMPLFYGLSRWFLVEYSLAAFVCVTIYLAIRVLESPGNRNLLLLGVVCGLGILLKTTFPLYVCPIFIYLFVRLAKERRWTWGTFLALTAPAILLPLPWYAANFREAIGRVIFSSFASQADQYGTGPVFSFSTIAQYLLIVANRCCTPYYLLLAGSVVLYLGLRGDLRAWWDSWPRQGRVVLGLWCVPFVAFLFGRAKDVKYLAPILPVLVLLIASLLDRALRRARQWWPVLAALILAFPLAAFLQTSFGVWGDARLNIFGFAFLVREAGYANVYVKRGWPHRSILERVVNETGIDNEHRKKVVVGTDFPEFNANNFELASILSHLPLEIESGAYAADLAGALAQVDSAAFFVYKDGGAPEKSPFDRYQKAVIERVQGSGFRELATGVPLPDGGVARIFAKTGSAESLHNTAFIRAGADQIDPCQFDFGGLVQLTGLTWVREPESMELRLRWRCIKTPGREYRCFVHVLDEAGKVIGHGDHFVLGGQPSMLTWRPGDVALETLKIPLIAGGGSNPDHLRLGLFEVASGDRLAATIIATGGGFWIEDRGTAISTPRFANSKRRD